MQGIVLNEEGYVTYPSEILSCIEQEVKNLNWRVSNVECGGDGTGYSFPFENCEEVFMSGEELYGLIQEHAQIQWLWGVLSGFPKDIKWNRIKNKPVVDITTELSYLDGKISHIDPDAVIEIIAIDSSETHVLADSSDVVKKLRQKYKEAEDLEGHLN